jgi:hypothetical protein
MSLSRPSITLPSSSFARPGQKLLYAATTLLVNRNYQKEVTTAGIEPAIFGLQQGP